MDWSGRQDLIAFSGWTPGEGASIWLVKPDGSDLRRITSSELSQNVMYPSWYPDGNALVVVDYQARGAPAVLKRIELETLTVQDLTNPDEIIAGKPSVSPDGRSIAFAGRRPGTPGGQASNRIWVLEEGHLRELDAEQGRTPAWSPDGGWVAFESNRGSPNGHYALFVVPAQGGVAVQLTSFEVNANHPAWSPDGRHIAFSVAPDLENMWRIAVLDVPQLRDDRVRRRPRP
jgi:Tol biopolymer transport system component